MKQKIMYSAVAVLVVFLAGFVGYQIGSQKSNSADELERIQDVNERYNLCFRSAKEMLAFPAIKSQGYESEEQYIAYSDFQVTIQCLQAVREKRKLEK